MAGQNLKKKSSFTISENQLSKIEKSAKVFFDLSSMKNGDLKIKSLKQMLLGQGKNWVLQPEEDYLFNLIS